MAVLFSRIIAGAQAMAEEKDASTAAGILSRMVSERRLLQATAKADALLLEETGSQDYTVSWDGREHVMAAVLSGCERHIMLDTRLLQASRLQPWLRREHALRIIAPQARRARSCLCSR